MPNGVSLTPDNNGVSRADAASAENGPQLDALYKQWKRDPSSVDAEWHAFFSGFELGCQQPPRRGGETVRTASVPAAVAVGIDRQSRVDALVSAYRRLGHQQAKLDPLNLLKRSTPELSLDYFKLTQGDLDKEVEIYWAGRLTRMTLRTVVDLLQETYCGHVGIEYMHIENYTHPPLAARPDRGGPAPQGRSPQRREEAGARASARRRAFREIPPHPVRRPEALFARGRRDDHPDPRQDRRGMSPARRRADRHGHGPSRAAQHPGQHPGQGLRVHLQRIRRKLRSRFAARRRRREIPSRLRGDRLHEQGDQDRPEPGPEPEPSRGGRPGRAGQGARVAAAAQRHRGTAQGAAHPHPRRRLVQRPGDRGGDAQSFAARGLPHGRDDPHRDQQPDRLHHLAGRRLLEPVLHLGGQDARFADFPRQRRRSDGRGHDHPARLRVSPAIPARCRRRHVLLPAPGPQRGRRAPLHPAAHVLGHRGPPAHQRNFLRPPGQVRRHHSRRSARLSREVRGKTQRRAAKIEGGDQGHRPRPAQIDDLPRIARPGRDGGAARKAARDRRGHHARAGKNRAQSKDQALAPEPPRHDRRQGAARLEHGRGARLRQPARKGLPGAPSRARTAAAAPSPSATRCSTT